ncbi:MAG TPA: zinc ribbon domain-containing protein [Pyrinomonadaceae bacterium]|nr:zinc ribbon domain-containing protein [Pyrinomonadaceae bacterium]
MFCPKCATQNVDGASYCRSCGANISLIPQALTGQLPPASTSERDYPDYRDYRAMRRRRRREPSAEEAIRTLVMGVAFVAVSVLVAKYAPAGGIWWFWMLIPAATFLGKGFSELARLKMLKKESGAFNGPQLNTVRPAEMPVPKTGELRPAVPSVTEGTTRHLGGEAETRHLDSHQSS